MSYQATGVCEHCGWEASAQADDLVTLRFELDIVLGAHVCCATCKQPIIEVEGEWFHATPATSDLPRQVEPWGSDLDNDHPAKPRLIDGSPGGSDA